MRIAVAAADRLHAGRKRLEFAMFGNTVPLRTNILYAAHHALSRARYATRSGHESNQRYGELASGFARNGYAVFHPPFAAEVLTDLAQRVDAAFETPELTYIPHFAAGLLFLKDALKVFPELERFLTEEVVGTVETYYRSHCKLFSAVCYRIFPVEHPPDHSFLWHFDNTPDALIKLMVYLDPATGDTVAFRLKPRPLSLALKRRGYWDRHSAYRFIQELDDEGTTMVFEGGVGTSILFRANSCLHKATHPTTGHRDVIVFFIHPSTIPLRDHLDRNLDQICAGYDSCANPFKDEPRLRLDDPGSVGRARVIRSK